MNNKITDTDISILAPISRYRYTDMDIGASLDTLQPDTNSFISLAQVHERSHSGEKPYKCNYENCGKAFATGYGLKSHTRTHTGEKPYPCPDSECNKGFKTSGDLQKHIRTHTGKYPYHTVSWSSTIEIFAICRIRWKKPTHCRVSTNHWDCTFRFSNFRLLTLFFTINPTNIPYDL